MGWFDEQIRQRKQSDDDVFSDSFISIAQAVMGKRLTAAWNDNREQTKNEIDRILKYYHVKSRDVPDDIKDVNEQLEYLLRPHGFMRRTITLEKGWYHDAIGAMLGSRTDNGMAVALIPTGLSGYGFYDELTGKNVKLNHKTEKMIDTEAICFYKPLPLKKIGIPDLMKYIVQTLSPADLVIFAIATFMVTLVGTLSPILSKLLFSSVIESGSVRLLMAMAIFVVCVAVATLIINAVKSLLMARINTKMNIAVQAATMMRVISLPPSFFKQYSSGELSSRSQNINVLCNLLVSAVLSTGLTSLFSLIYIVQIFTYAPALVVPALTIILITVLFSLVSTISRMNISRKRRSNK